jgi:hypothetical protein
MEFTKKEILVVEEAVAVIEAQVQDLRDLQLALVGGGIGDTVHV